MSGGAAGQDARRALLGGLIDDAAQFPPARLPLDDALAGYRRNRDGPHAWLQGRFLCPSHLLADLPADQSSPPAPEVQPWVGAVVAPDRASPDALAEVLAARDPRVTAVEVALPADPGGWAEYLAALEVPTTVRRAYLEVPVRALDPAEAVALLAAAREHPRQVEIAAKLRCGGVTADAVPPVEVVAAFLAACVARAVPFKATAGLHHPLRHLDEDDGWVHHGFLNVLGGAVLHHAGAVGATDLGAVVAETDPAAFAVSPSAFAWRGAEADAGAVARARTIVHGQGSCSFDEPVTDLRALGMIA